MACIADYNIFARPVIPLLISLMIGITFGASFPAHDLVASLAIIFCFALILAFIIKKQYVFFAPLILFFCLGYLSINSYLGSKFRSDHIIYYTDKCRWNIVGIVSQRPTNYNNRLKVIVDVKRLEKNKRIFKVKGKIRVTVRGNCPKLSVGDRIIFKGRLNPIRNFETPGRFDYRRYMAFKGVFASSYTKGDRIKILSNNSGKGRIIDNVRGNISGLIEKHSTKEQKGVLKALLIGERYEILPYVQKAFNRAGVGHILDISGLHIGIVATFSFVFFSWGLSFFRPLLWKAWIKKGAAVLSLVPVFIYGLISGMSPSTQRAVIMAAVFLLTFIIERDHDLINTLAVAALLILIIFPPSLFSVSFQLSFAAVFSIIYGLSKINPIQKNIKGQDTTGFYYKIKKRLIPFIMVSIFAVIGTMPIVMYYFNQISFVGIIANIIIIPIVGFIVVPLGLFSIFIYPFSVFGASCCISATSYILGIAVWIVRVISDLPFAAAYTVTPSGFEICCYYIFIWAVLNTGFFQKKFDPIKRKLALIVLVLVVIAGFADVFYWVNRRFYHDDLRVTVIDVWDGSSALLELPGGYVILIDGGGFSGNSVFDIGARIIAPLLWKKKIKTVNTLILSHPNSDHLNGFLFIAEYFNAKNLWTNGQSADTAGYERFIEIIKEEGINNPSYNVIVRSRIINGVEIKILYPQKNFIDKIEKEKWRDLNNNSLVVKVCFGSKSFLFPGDIETAAEKELVSIRGDELKSTVLIAPHHGSKTSSSRLLLDHVEPEFIIISSGSGFNFPHRSVLRRYKDYGCRIFKTSTDGAITISTDGRSIDVKPFAKKS